MAATFLSGPPRSLGRVAGYRVTTGGDAQMAVFDADDEQEAEARGRSLARAHRSGRPSRAAERFSLERRTADGWEAVTSWELPGTAPRRAEPEEPAI